MDITKIATLLTVHNRKQKTLSCLQHLFAAIASCQQLTGRQLQVTVFITNDGCTDGTEKAIKNLYPQEDIHIIQGSGNLFWAGGMRLAWQTAIDSGQTWDYFLLLNDDTDVRQNVFEQLFEAQQKGLATKGINGIASGITCDKNNPEQITYGGFIFANKTKGRHTLALPTGQPQEIDLAHANILLIHKQVVDTIGIFHDGFLHGCADHDYSLMAQRHGIPIMATAQVCGACDYDHESSENEILQLRKMSLAERKRFINSPTHSDRDYLLLIRRHMPMRYPMAVLLRRIRLYCPTAYYWITNLRGIYKTE